MQKVISISGGQTSAYIAANYPFDHLVFALVRTDDQRLKFKDEKARQMVSDRIGTEFIGTLEQDTIIYTMLDLEQYLGHQIDWVTGPTFDQLIQNRGGYLPNVMARFCTTEMKMFPIAQWWRQKFEEQPVEMAIGYRFNERNRAETMRKQLDENGLSPIKLKVGHHKNGNNKWQVFKWRKPTFPLIEDMVDKIEVMDFWDGKPVRFAQHNNCVGCFHRSSRLLKMMSELEPEKFQWFVEQEGNYNGGGYWKSSINYQKILDTEFTRSLFGSEDEGGCPSGFCGM